MADGLLDMIIQQANFDSLTAVASDGLSGKSFVGKNGSTYNGSIVDRGSPYHSLGVNASITLPEGKYTGGTVKQTLATMNGYTVYPGSKNITVPTANVYMTGDIKIAGLPNLVPENIKEGEYVGGVGPGEWKGYVVTDPYTFYYRGTFSPGQSISDYVALDTYHSHMAERINDLKYILYQCGSGISDGGDRVYSVFNSPIDLTSVNLLTVEYSVYAPGNTTMAFEAYLTTEKNTSYQTVKNLAIASKADSIKGPDTTEKKRSLTIDVSSLSRYAYLSLYINLMFSGFYLKIHSVKFE